MGWMDAAFLHWPLPAAELRPLVPAPLALDLHEGRAWISLVAFTMRSVRPRGLPAAPFLSSFDEINLRTYVAADGVPGVYFLSIDSATRLSAALARALTGLPYRYAPIRREGDGGRSRVVMLAGDGARSLDLAFTAAPRVEPETASDIFLTERYCLYHACGGNLSRRRVAHPQWPLESLRLERLEARGAFAFPSVLEGSPALTHYSPGVPVLGWGPENLGVPARQMGE